LDEGTYSFIIAINRQPLIVKATIFGILLNIAFNYWFIKLGWQIKGIALGTMLSRTVVGFVYLFFVANNFFLSLKEILFKSFQLISPFCFIGGGLIFLEYLFPAHGVLTNEYIFVILKLLFLILFSVPFLRSSKKIIKRVDFGFIKGD